MSTLDEAWRSLINGRNERTLCDTMYQNLKQVADYACENQLIVDVPDDFLKGLKDATHDISEFVKVVNGFGIVKSKEDDRDLNIRMLGQTIVRRENYADHAPGDRHLYGGFAIDVQSLSRTLQSHRNDQRHDSRERNNPAETLQLASTILKLFDISLDNLDEGQEQLRDEAKDAIKLVVVDYFSLEPDESGEEPASNNDRVREPSGDDVVTVQEIVDQKLTEFGSKLIDIRSSLDGMDENLRSQGRQIQQALNHSHVSDHMLERRVAEDHPLYEDMVYEEDDEIEAIVAAIDNNVRLTPSQAREQFVALRNEIRQAYGKGGRTLEPWENILQVNPIVNAMMKHRPHDIDSWKVMSPEVSQRYHRHKIIMDEQIERYGGRMFEIMDRIVSAPNMPPDNFDDGTSF